MPGYIPGASNPAGNKAGKIPALLQLTIQEGEIVNKRNKIHSVSVLSAMEKN